MHDTYEELTPQYHTRLSTEHYCHRIGEDSLYRMLLMRVVECSVDRVRNLIAVRGRHKEQSPVLVEWAWLNCPADGRYSPHRGFTFRELCRFLSYEHEWMLEKIRSQFSRQELMWLDRCVANIEREAAKWSEAQRMKHEALLARKEEMLQRREEREERKQQRLAAAEVLRVQRKLSPKPPTQARLPSPRPRKLVQVGQTQEASLVTQIEVSRGLLWVGESECETTLG